MPLCHGKNWCPKHMYYFLPTAMYQTAIQHYTPFYLGFQFFARVKLTSHTLFLLPLPLQWTPFKQTSFFSPFSLLMSAHHFYSACTCTYTHTHIHTGIHVCMHVFYNVFQLNPLFFFKEKIPQNPFPLPHLRERAGVCVRARLPHALLPN